MFGVNQDLPSAIKKIDDTGPSHLVTSWCRDNREPLRSEPNNWWSCHPIIVEIHHMILHWLFPGPRDEAAATGLVPVCFTLRVWSEQEIAHTPGTSPSCRYTNWNTPHVLSTSCSSGKRDRLDASKSDNFSSDCLNKKNLEICKPMMSSLNFVHYSFLDSWRNES